jgi:hypothetical protein
MIGRCIMGLGVAVAILWTIVWGLIALSGFYVCSEEAAELFVWSILYLVIGDAVILFSAGILVWVFSAFSSD